jgi:hypothetical protein
VGSGRLDDSCLFAASAGTRRAAVWNLAGTVATGVAAGGCPDGGGSEPISAGALHSGDEPEVSSAGRAAGPRLCAGWGPGSGPHLFGADGTGGGKRQHGGDQRSLLADRAHTVARDAGGSTVRLCTQCDGKRATRSRRLGRAALPLTSVALRAPSASGEEKPKPDRSCAIKTGHLHVLTTERTHQIG